MRGSSRSPRGADRVSSHVRRYWINTVSLDHVDAAAAGGFTQANHGSDRLLRGPQRGDEMIFYSPRTDLRGGRPVRQFTARATITGTAPYRAHVSEDFEPWRLAADFRPSRAADAKPLVHELSFITDPTRWGLPFRRGLFPIPQQDFAIIANHMSVDPEGSEAHV